MSSPATSRSSSPGAGLWVGDWRVDVAAGTLSRAGEEARLEPKVMDVLVCLIEAEGAVVSKDDILDRVWPDAVVEEAALSRCVSELRRALGDDAKSPRYVETLPKRGYRLTAPVRSAEGTGRSWQLAWPWVLAASIALAVLAAGIYRRSRLPDEATAIRSVAVLPVENLTGDVAQDFFAEGITDGLITELGSSRAFDRVTSRSSTAGFDSDRDSLAEIGDRLGVDGIIEASMLSVADAVRINVRMVHAASDNQVWTGSFAGDPGDITALYRQVVRALVEDLGGRAGDEPGAVAARAVDPAAYAAYVRGRHFWSQRTVEGYERAEEYFRQAVAIDDQYAAAYAGLADNFFMAGQPSRAVAAREARSYAAIALALDDSLAEAHTTTAFIAVFDWQWQAAEDEFRTAIELNPSYVTAHHWYGLLLSWLGRFDEADAQLVWARQLDPLSPLLVIAHASVHNNAGRFERAIRLSEESLALDPDFSGAHELLAVSYTELGQYDDAIAHAEIKAAVDPSVGSRAVLAHTYAAAGRVLDARRILADFEALDDGVRTEEDVSFYEAGIHAAMGERDLALDDLERAYAEGSDNIVTIAVSPWLQGLHDDPGFNDLLRRMGLKD